MRRVYGLATSTMVNAPHWKNGAGDEVRTRDNQLGKLVLYQLSYTRIGADLARPLRGVNAIVVALAENPAIM